MSKLTINNLSKIIDGKIIIDSINLSVDNGEFLTILGKSGAGKTMLLNCITGFENVDNGSIFLDNEDITNMDISKRNFALVDQDILLFEHMSVFDNIAFGLKMKKDSKDLIKQKVMKLAKKVEIEDKLESYPNQLSGGQQQRVAIARALAIQPRLLLLDEPFNKLDINLRSSMQNLLKKIAIEEKLTVVLVSHDKDEALKLSDKLAIIDNGQILEYGIPYKLFNNPDNIEILRFFNYMNILDASIFNNNDKRYAIVNPKKIKIIEGNNYEIIEEEYLGNYYKYKIMYNKHPLIIESDVKINDNEIDIEINEDDVYFY